MRKRVLFCLLIFLIVLPLNMASAATYYYVHGTSSLNVREQAGTGASIQTTVSRDLAVVSYKKASSGWAYVHFSNGVQGYVMRKYLKSSTTAIAYVESRNAVLRSAPSSSASKSADLKQGTRVKVLTGGSVWSYVSTDAGTGYIQKSDLTPNPVQKVTASHAAYVVNSTGRTVNVRAGAGKKYAVLGSLAPGTKVTVEKTEGKWSKISGSISGWMMSQYLSVADQDSLSAEADPEDADLSLNQDSLSFQEDGIINADQNAADDDAPLSGP